MSKEKKPKSYNWRSIFILFSLAMLIAGALGYNYFRKLFLPNVPEKLTNEFLYIPSGSNYTDLLDTLHTQGFILNRGDFEWVSERMSFHKRPVRSGRFSIQPKWTNRQLINHLRIGKQAPVEIVLTNERLPENIAKKIAKKIEPSAAWLVAFFTSEDSLKALELTPEIVTTVFIPNTYKVYWNSTPKSILEKMIKEKNKFWAKKDRLAKAKALGLSTEEVYTVASIVERESNYNPEKPKIASVYLNRIRKGMKLQADPTCVFARRDFGATRVTNYHLKFESPYNTYIHEGLPPGPISMASIASIDAVLNEDKTDYIFFCAKPNTSGQHAFAKTLRGHNHNASRFHTYQRKRRRDKAEEALMAAEELQMSTDQVPQN